MQALAPSPAPLSTESLLDKAKAYAEASKAPNTRDAYRSDWDAFASFCEGRGLCPLPAEPMTVALFLAHEAETKKTNTVTRRLSAIASAHGLKGLPSPTSDAAVKAVLAGILRTHVAPEVRKRPLTADLIRQALPAGDGVAAVRDRALLLFGFATAMRRSELVGIRVDDLEFVEEGVLVRLSRSKTNQEGEEEVVAVPYAPGDVCPVRALKAWLGHVREGVVFRRVYHTGKIGEPLTAQSVALLVKRAAEKLGLDPEQFSGHSLRSGFVTTAYKAGHKVANIMRQTRHRSERQVYAYVRSTALFEDSAAAGLF